MKRDDATLRREIAGMFSELIAEGMKLRSVFALVGTAADEAGGPAQAVAKGLEMGLFMDPTQAEAMRTKLLAENSPGRFDVPAELAGIVARLYLRGDDKDE